VLVVDDHEWTARSLESVLSPAGYAVMRAYTGRNGHALARAQDPDLVFINVNLPDCDGIELCRTLREEPELGAGVPIIMLGTGRPTRQQRIAALEAGAWEVLSHPLDARELILKLSVFTRAKLEIDRVRRDALIDHMTGLYTVVGLERRAHELRSLTYRQEDSLACVVLAPSSASASLNGIAEADATRLADVLKSAGRLSDAIGRMGKNTFAIFAPQTDAMGAAKLAERLAAVMENETGGEEPVRLRAGYDAVPNVHEAPAQARELLSHATIALRRALQASDSQWLQGFEHRTTPS
jgi:DNA-binding response OmpR family regulator